MKAAAIASFGFSLLIAATIIIALIVNPRHSDPVYVGKAIVFGGFLFSWALLTAHALNRGRGLASAFGFVGFMSFLVVLGAMLVGFASPEPTSPVLRLLRILDGVSVLLLWLAVVRAAIIQSKGNQAGVCQRGRRQG